MLKLLIRTDTDAAAEALADALEQNLAGGVTVADRATGAIREDDVRRAAEAGAVVIGFHVRPTPQARSAAEAQGVEILLYNTFSQAVEELRSRIEGTPPPPREWQELGRAEVRKMLQKGLDVVALCAVTDGTLNRRELLRVFRDGVQVYEGRPGRLRRLGREVRSAEHGQECELAFEFYNELRAGDVLECVATRPS